MGLSTPPSNTDSIRDATTEAGARRRLHAKQIIASRYEICELLGRGGMGEVWRAHDQKLRIDVALKGLRRISLSALDALRQEVRSAREVNSPNVCRIFDLVVEGDQEFVSMEYIDGITLLDLIKKKSPLDLREAQEIASQFLAGLDAIHNAGLIHRDLKPENIMITRTGRVVVMDFGIAKLLTQQSGTGSGTPPYMAPEQFANGKLDSRTDLFAAGAILAEMVHPSREEKSREKIWQNIRQDPPKLNDSPWQPILTRAISKNPESRFPSAGALAHALQEVIQRLEIIEQRKPYPGLAAFTEADTEYFFGRELEVETLLKKLEQWHLLAIIGPSGAGKTSFLSAGLIAALRSSCSIAFTQPGESPLTNLGQSLAVEFAGDPIAIRKMVRLEKIDDARWLLDRWGQKHPETLLIVDRFEELFTLNDTQTQSVFAELLGHTALESNVRILLAMRDDFLIFCKEHPSLAPIFSDLTALLPLSGSSLKRALIQPALQCGYRFDDDALVDEILAGVQNERGALPLIAFTAARLWEERDRQASLLTRAAYQQIGGVSGALAQHAESTMEQIGTEHHTIVREIFRNLVTPKNTRVARDVEEILSVFADRESANQVLQSLIDARLLISFETPAQESEQQRMRRVEIIHESLLSAWPRLVHWQTKDAESAQFRDQLHHVANVWEERGRPAELLWRGSSYKEFEVWRDKYSGGLTATEKAFAEAMLQHAHRARTRRAIIIAGTFVLLLGILGVIAGFWQNEKIARQEAVSQAKLSEASKLLALGRTEIEHDPTLAFAYAVASLERADTTAARRFALQALWVGPPAFIMPDMPVRPSFLNVSRDGKWLAAGGNTGVRLLSRTGETIVLDEGIPAAKVHWHRKPQIAPNNDFVIWTLASDPSTVRVWSISQSKTVREFQFEGATISLVRGPKLILISDLTNQAAGTLKWEESRIRTWGFDEVAPKVVEDWNQKEIKSFDISSDAKHLVYAKGRNVYMHLLEDTDGQDQLAGRHQNDVANVTFHPNGKTFVSADVKGEIRMWATSQNSETPFFSIPARNTISNLFFNFSGSIFACIYSGTPIALWDMNGPIDADPKMLQRAVPPFYPYLGFDPSGRYVIATYNDSLAFWPLHHPDSYVLHGDGDKGAEALSFTPDGKQLTAGFMQGAIELWQIGDLRTRGRELWRPSGPAEIYRLGMDPKGKQIAIATNNQGANIIKLADGKARRMPGIGAGAVSFSPDGKLIAAESYGNILLWDLASDKVRTLNTQSEQKGAALVKFSSDGTLFSQHNNGDVFQWNIETGTNKLLARGNKKWHALAVASNNPRILACLWNDGGMGDLQRATSELRILDLKTGKSQQIRTHGNRIYAVALDPTGTILVTGDMDGTLRVGPISGDEPHLLLGHVNGVLGIAVDPNLQWIASSESRKPVVRLWRMPKGTPLHTLPYDELLKKLKSLTNVRVVLDQTSSTGYRIEFDRFPGWSSAPTW